MTDGDHERAAFITVAMYHFRRKGESDRCAICGPLPLGSSFPEHQWDEFEKLRSSPKCPHGYMPGDHHYDSGSCRPRGG